MHDFKIRKHENKRGNRRENSIPDRYNMHIWADSGYQGMQKKYNLTAGFINA